MKNIKNIAKPWDVVSSDREGVIPQRTILINSNSCLHIPRACVAEGTTSQSESFGLT